MNAPRSPLPAFEAVRLAALARFGILDTPSEPAFDDLVSLASIVCDAPYALVNFVAADRLWTKARLGLDVRELPRSESFCAHAILGTAPLVLMFLAFQRKIVDSMSSTGLKD